MNRRRALSAVHRRIARGQGVNAAAWFAGQSFHQSAADVPFERIPMKELDKAGAALLPREHEPARCAFCGEVDDKTHDAARCAINQENS